MKFKYFISLFFKIILVVHHGPFSLRCMTVIAGAQFPFSNLCCSSISVVLPW